MIAILLFALIVLIVKFYPPIILCDAFYIV